MANEKKIDEAEDGNKEAHQKHFTIIPLSQEIVLQKCRDPKCCDSQKVHCPFCDTDHYKPTKPSRVRDHLELLHLSYAVQCEDLIVVKCFWNCVHPAGHYHCPYCPSQLRKRYAFTVHLQSHMRKMGKDKTKIIVPDPKYPAEIKCGDHEIRVCVDKCDGDPTHHYHCPLCSMVRKNRSLMMNHLWRCIEKPYGKRNVSSENFDKEIFIRTPEVEHIPHPKTVKEIKWHHSIVRNLSDLPVGKCVLNNCCGHKYHCPLCTQERFKPNYLRHLRFHYYAHWKRRMQYKDYSILLCNERCELSEGISKLRYHFHCPICGATRRRRKGFTHHLQICNGEKKSWHRKSFLSGVTDNSQAAASPQSVTIKNVCEDMDIDLATAGDDNLNDAAPHNDIEEEEEEDEVDNIEIKQENKLANISSLLGKEIYETVTARLSYNFVDAFRKLGDLEEIFSSVAEETGTEWRWSPGTLEHMPVHEFQGNINTLASTKSLLRKKLFGEQAEEGQMSHEHIKKFVLKDVGVQVEGFGNESTVMERKNNNNNNKVPQEKPKRGRGRPRKIKPDDTASMKIKDGSSSVSKKDVQQVPKQIKTISLSNKMDEADETNPVDVNAKMNDSKSCPSDKTVETQAVKNSMENKDCGNDKKSRKEVRDKPVEAETQRHYSTRGKRVDVSVLMSRRQKIKIAEMNASADGCTKINANTEVQSKKKLIRNKFSPGSKTSIKRKFVSTELMAQQISETGKNSATGVTRQENVKENSSLPKNDSLSTDVESEFEDTDDEDYDVSNDYRSDASDETFTPGKASYSTKPKAKKAKIKRKPVHPFAEMIDKAVLPVIRLDVGPSMVGRRKSHKNERQLDSSQQHIMPKVIKMEPSHFSDANLNSVSDILNQEVEDGSSNSEQKSFLGKIPDGLHCSVCIFTAEQFTDVTEHLMTAHNIENPLRCDVCERMFDRASDIKSHLERKHGPFHKQTEFQCHLCKKSFEGKAKLNWHLSYSHKITQTTETKKAYKCSRCEYVAESYMELIKHKEELHIENSKLCNLCGKVFTKGTHLITHMQAVHTKEKAAECKICCKKFNHIRYLRTHLKRHAGIKKHECPICGWKFFESNTLKDHIETHKEASKRRYRFTCHFCGQRYVSKANFSDHVNKHTGDKPHTCDLCGKGFAFRTMLVKHKIHIHTTEKPFKCNCCERAFKFKSKLLQHMVIHTGISNYVCSSCHKPFSCNATLKHHRPRCRGEGSWQRRKTLEETLQISLTTEQPEGSTVEIPVAEQGNIVIDMSGLPEGSINNGNLGFLHAAAQAAQLMEIPEVFMCSECNTVFGSLADAESHITTCHGDLEASVATKTEQEIEIKILDSDNNELENSAVVGNNEI